MTKIAILVDSLHSAGGESVAVRIAVNLKRSAHYEPIVFVTRHGGPLADQLTAEGVRYVILSRKHAYELHKFSPFLRALRDEDIQLIHAHKQGSNFWGGLIGALVSVPVLSHVHGQGYSRLVSNLNKLIAKLSVKMIAVSRQLNERLIEEDGVAPAKTVVIYNGIDCSGYHTIPNPETRKGLGLGADTPIVGIAAGLRREKRHDVFLRGASDVIKRGTRAHFLVIGGGEMEGDLRRLVSDLELDDHVTFTGHVSNVPDLLSAIDIGVLTSDREGMPLALLEYMASGKPVVATRVGGVPEAVEDGVNGFLFASGDHEGFAGRIAQLVNDAALRSRMGAAALEIVTTRFSEQVMMERIVELYRATLGKRQAENIATSD